MTQTLGSPLVDLTFLPDFAAWQTANPGFTLAQYGYPTIRPDHFFAVGSLLWPKLIQHEGGLFLEDGFEIPTFDQWLAQTSSLTATERVMNHRHMRDMLRSFANAPRELLLSAANLMQQCWKGRLYQLCPETPATVEVYETDFDVEITLYVVRPQPNTEEDVVRKS